MAAPLGKFGILDTLRSFLGQFGILDTLRSFLGQFCKCYSNHLYTATLGVHNWALKVLDSTNVPSSAPK